MERRESVRLLLGAAGGAALVGCGGGGKGAQLASGRGGGTQVLGGGTLPAPSFTTAPRARPMDVVSPPGADRFHHPATLPGVLAGSLLVVDVRTGRALGHKQPDRRRAVASTQKLLTALLVLERGGLDRPVLIRDEDTKAPPSKMYLKAGERYTRRELLSVVLVKSANDAAHALARDHSGSVPGFSAAMNRRARSLGAFDSWFVNPHGLTEAGQYSTARDIARISLAAYRQPFVRNMALRRSVVVRGKTYKATNKLLKRMPQCTGLKTGYTVAAGRCFVATGRFGGRDVMAVQLGSKERVIWDDAARLLRWGALV